MKTIVIKRWHDNQAGWITSYTCPMCGTASLVFDEQLTDKKPVCPHLSHTILTRTHCSQVGWATHCLCNDCGKTFTIFDEEQEATTGHAEARRELEQQEADWRKKKQDILGGHFDLLLNVAMEVEGYCVKCREKRVIKDAKEVTMKNGRLAAKGSCPVCGAGMFKFLSKKRAALYGIDLPHHGEDDELPW